MAAIGQQEPSRAERPRAVLSLGAILQLAVRAAGPNATTFVNFLMHAASRFCLAAAATAMAFLSLPWAGSDDVDAGQQEPALAGVEQWFAAWELVSRDIYGIDTLRPVEFIFFDDQFVYSTSPGTGGGESVVDGPGFLPALTLVRIAG